MIEKLLIAIVASTLFGCAEPEEPSSIVCSDIGTEGNSLLFSFTSDFTTGELRWMSPDSVKYSQGELSFGQDTYVAAAGENLFIMSRYPGVLSCVKARNICNKKAIKQAKLDGENPYETIVIGDKGYIALWDTHYIQVFDPNACAPTGKIPMPELISKNPASIKASGDTLLIAVQRLEWEKGGIMSQKTPNGLLVRINASAGTLIDTISLKLYNPHKIALSKGKLYVAQNGLYDPNMEIIADGAGLEVVDLATGTTEVLIAGSELGSGVQNIAMDEEGQILYMLVYRKWGDAPIIPFDLLAKKALDPLPNVIDGFGGLIFDEVARKLFIGERDDEFGLKVYDPATKTTTPIIDYQKYPLPPYSQAIARW